MKDKDLNDLDFDFTDIKKNCLNKKIYMTLAALKYCSAAYITRKKLNTSNFTDNRSAVMSKLFGVASLVAVPPCWNSTTRLNQAI